MSPRVHGMMTSDDIRPYSSDVTSSSRGPHLADYWYVVTRHLWLVAAVLALTVGSTALALAHRPVHYEATATLQVNDPLQQSRTLTSGSRITNSDIFVDPIQSEIELLSSTALAGRVVEAAGLRLQTADSDLPRSALIAEAWVAPEVPAGTVFGLRYGENGSVELLGEGGGVLARGEAGREIDGGVLRITPSRNPDGRREYRLYVAPAGDAITDVRYSLSARPREGTNLIDLRYVGLDSALAAPIANRGAEALRAMGAERVRERAAHDVRFIRQQLDSARTQLRGSLNAIRTFKESEAFTSLSFEEQALVNEGHRLVEDVARHEWHLSVFRALTQGLENSGAEGVDLARFLAELPADANPEIRMGATRIQEKANELDRVLTIDLKTRAHPAARALIDQIDLLQGELIASVRASIGVTEQKLRSAAASLDEVRTRQRAFPAIANQLQTLELQQELDQDAYQFLLSQLYQARIAEAAAGPYVHIVDPAMGASLMARKVKGYLVLASMLGLFLGVTASLFVEYLDRTVRTRSEAEGLLGIPVLATIPGLKRRPRNGVPSIEGPHLVVRDPFDPAGEAFRNLRLNLTFVRIDDRPLRTILVTSAGPQEGKSTTALNLAATLAQYGERVLLIDADLRRPTVHDAMDLDRDPGLTNLLIRSATADRVIRRDVIPNLDVMPAGPTPPSPAELVGSLTMSETLGRLEDDYDRVVVDSPPVLAVTDAAGTAAFVDGVLLVIRSGSTEQRAAEHTVEHLRRLGIRVLGVALNDIQPRVHEESYHLRYQARYDLADERFSGPTPTRLRGALAKVRLR